MTGTKRTRKIESYGQAYDRLLTVLSAFSTESWHFKPAPGEFSIHEIIVHIADSEANSYVRCRRAIAEPGLGVMAYDPAVWAEALAYPEQSAQEALELFRLLRLRSFRLIQSLTEDTWGNTIEHPENGTMTLDDWLDVYERHIPEHIEQMQAVHAAWQLQQSEFPR